MSVSETYNMDCMEYMRTLPDKAFELAIVDPVYGGVTSGGYFHNRSHKIAKNRDYNNTIWSQNKTAKQYFDELFRVSKNQIIWGGNYFAEEINKNSQCWIVWDKQNGENNFADCELAWTSFDTAVRKFEFKWQGMLQHDMKNKEVRIHPTQKPVALYKWLLLHYAHAGDRILDTHLGSGSSRIAAYDMGFDFVGIELDKDYFEAEEKRYNEHISQLDLIKPEEIQQL